MVTVRKALRRGLASALVIEGGAHLVSPPLPDRPANLRGREQLGEGDPERSRNPLQPIEPDRLGSAALLDAPHVGTIDASATCEFRGGEAALLAQLDDPSSEALAVLHRWCIYQHSYPVSTPARRQHQIRRSSV
jgi:hypothetical protein